MSALIAAGDKPDKGFRNSRCSLIGHIGCRISRKVIAKSGTGCFGLCCPTRTGCGQRLVEVETRRTQRIWVELALRAEKDAKAIKAAEELSQLGTIDPSHLTPQQEALLEEIARNCLQNAEGGKVVIGTMKGLDNGYIDAAAETGAVYYHNHQAVWDTLGELGEEQQAQAAWLINQK